ncbi:MAG TPA: lytic murein transglycosylase, partial [Candidatus Thioglobus sp.]|nr:lytic murein transglycosylase [Candidatus Thioglobus sp.]
MLRLIFCLLLTTFVNADDSIGSSDAHSFEEFLADIRTQAFDKGVSLSTLNQAFKGLTPNPKVIKFDRTQAEFSQNFWRYLGSRVSKYRLDKGTEKLAKHQQTLQDNYKKYGVPPHIVVAFWGLETNYGSNTGSLSLVRSLATLSFDQRRSAFFTEQLLALLKLIDEGKIPMNAKGSWAGAMGNVQFMPTNVAAYGIDADADGEIGLWDNEQDIFASAANFLQKIGWHRSERWGREVNIPKPFDYQLANLNTKKTVNEWQTLGVRTAEGKDLPNSTMQASLILPMGYNGPAFLAYRNFRAILRWNRSILYALSVGHLSDRLAGT